MSGKTLEGKTSKGFGELKGVSTDYDYDSAVDIESLEYEKVPISYYWEKKEFPPLPVGFYIKQKGSEVVEHLTTYTFKEKELNSGQAEMFLDKAEEKTRDGKAAVTKLATFLARVVDTIGGYPLQEIVERYGNTAEIIFQRAWLADIFTMYISAKLQVSGMPYAVSGLECPCFKKSIIFDDGVDRPLHNLGDIEIKYFVGLGDRRPLFRVNLEEGFNDGKSTVKTLYCMPLKLNDIAVFTDSKGQDTAKIKSFQRMVVGIPESEVYGIKRGEVFNEEIYKLMTRKERRYIDRTIIPKLQPGPINKVEVSCHNCNEAPKVSYTLPWLNQTSYFLFGIDEPNIPEED